MPERSAPQPRQPSALLRGSVALHLSALGALLARPRCEVAAPAITDRAAFEEGGLRAGWGPSAKVWRAARFAAVGWAIAIADSDSKSGTEPHIVARGYLMRECSRSSYHFSGTLR